MKPGKAKPRVRIGISPLTPEADANLLAWVSAVNDGREKTAEMLYAVVRSLYDQGARPDWKAAGLPGPEGFFGWSTRNLKSPVVIKVESLTLADDEVLYRSGIKRLPASTYPGFRGEPSRLPGMKRG